MKFFYTHLLISISLFGIICGGVYNWLGIIILFLGMPICEILTQNIKYQPQPKSNTLAEWALLLTPFYLSIVLVISFYQLKFQKSQIEFISLALSTGALMGAFGITCAHELIHRRETKYQNLGYYSLMLINFGYWGVEHVYGHHKKVATLNDPATARKNEIIYVFWVREFIMSIRSVFNIDKYKLLFFAIVSALTSIVLYYLLGSKYVVFWWLLSLVGMLLLQTVDYIEHYGLLREKKPDGSSVAFGIQHAWDTNSTLTNWALFNLGLHSHHHLKASVPFENLEIQENSHKMPWGYSVMVVLALFPMFFIPLMNRRLVKLTASV